MTIAMVLLAGCSSGGGGGTESPTSTSVDTTAGTTPTESPVHTTSAEPPMSSTPTPDGDGTPTPDEDGTPTPGGSDTNGSQLDARTMLSELNASDPFRNATQMEVSLINGSQNADILVKNDTDTQTQLIRFSQSSGGTLTLYTTPDYVAFRNTTSGEIRYGKPGGTVGTGVKFVAAFGILGGISYAGIVKWDKTGTTTIDGKSALVYESDSLNHTALNNKQNTDFGFDQNDVQSVDARMVVTRDGRIQSITVRIETSQTTVGSDLTVDYDDITITQPDWVDESKASS
ncbi:MAG: hypothetical protein ABEI57_01020 [Halapricum sp.]